MSTGRQATWSRPGYNTSERYSSSESGRDGGAGSGLGSTMVGMMMLPWNMLVGSMRAVTDATVGMGQAATQSMSNMTASGPSSQSGQASQSSWTGGGSTSSGGGIFGGSGSTGSGTGGGLTGTVNQMLIDTDLSGDDLKYVTYCIVSTKPGFEAVLKPQCEELVNYSTDGSTYAALKIARCLDDIRQGKVERPEGWGSDTHDTATATARTTTAHTDYTQGTHASQTQTTQSTWRIEPHDEKYLQVIYKVERRLPKRTEYREEVTVRTTTNTSSIS